MEYDKAGYKLDPYVIGFVETAIAPVPRVSTTLSLLDYLGTLGARTGFLRNDYKVVPGLYCSGKPSAASPVLVTANYKLSFDSLRKELGDIDAWILVVDTRGINVWCAAGKGTFSSEEVAYQIRRCNLEQLVDHREVILPQLCGNGVAAHNLNKLCGFKGKFGPILASSIPEYLEKKENTKSMRTVTFTIAERAVLIPLEICMLFKPLLLCSILLFIFSGFSPDIFSMAAAISRGFLVVSATITGIIGGAALTPLLLPWVPCKQFWLKGAIVGALTAILFLGAAGVQLLTLESIGLFFWITSCASYLGMNFTGSTPFTSLSGVEKEMRKGLPFQIITTILSLTCWFIAPFV